VGTHTVTVTDDNGCVETFDVTIGEPIPLQIDVVSPDTTVCVGDSAFLYTSGSGGSSAYTYTWTLNGNVVGTGETLGVLPTDYSSNYCVTLSEQCGSPETQECLNVRYPEDITPLISPDITGACFPVEVNFQNVTNTSENIASTVWSYGDGVTDTVNGLNQATHEFGEGLFDISVEVITESGCSYVETFNDLIEGYPYPEAKFYVNPNPASVFEPEVDAFSQSGADIVSYQWIAEGAKPANSSLQNPTFEYPNEVENYDVSLIVENSKGCLDTMERIVRIQNEVLLFAPNTFTPDGDEYNEEWKVFIQGVDIYNFHLELFNRWGELIWESHDAEIGWDGTYGNELVKEGTYVWKIRAFDAENDNKYEFNGFVNVIR
jgi:gliding motility-associated-like protein